MVLLMYVYAGDPPPAVNEAHYLTKAKNFWQPDWCAGDLFVSSGKAHATFYATFGALTTWMSLSGAAWAGRWIGWTMLAVAAQRLSWSVAPVRYASLLVVMLWIVGVERANFAGEWVVGGIEAKVPAYALVLLAMERMVRGRWTWVWPLLGAASAFHVLVGGWSVIAAAVAWGCSGRQRGSLRQQVIPLVIGGALSLLGLLPSILLSAEATPSQATMAARIYAYQRISHHLLPASFPWQWYARHAALLAVTAAVLWPVVRRPTVRPIAGFTLGAVIIAALGLLVGMLPALAPDLAARLLRFYWFRLTDAVTPLALAIGLAAWWYRPPEVLGVRAARGIVGVAALVASLSIAQHYLQAARVPIPPSCQQNLIGGWAAQRSPEEQIAVYRDWVSVCHWIGQNTAEDEVFLTPRHQQTFKWYAHRAEVVNWKDVPQDAASLLEWSKRFDQVFPARLGRVRVTIRYDALRDFSRQYGARYMVVDRRVVGQSLPLVQIYPGPLDENATYAVYRLPYEG